jgi:hypothetical protein
LYKDRQFQQHLPPPNRLPQQRTLTSILVFCQQRIQYQATIYGQLASSLTHLSPYNNNALDANKGISISIGCLNICFLMPKFGRIHETSSIITVFDGTIKSGDFTRFEHTSNFNPPKRKFYRPEQAKPHNTQLPHE